MFKNKKIFFIKTIFLFFYLHNLAFADLEDALIRKIENTYTLNFKFKQYISKDLETGDCFIRYPKLIKCDYNDSYKKRLISNGKTLAVIQRRYKKIFYYPLKNTPLNFILDKQYLIKFIEKNKPKITEKEIIVFENLQQNKKIEIIFDKKSFALKGWSTTDTFNNELKFLVLDLKTNIPIDDKIFIIPEEGKL